MAQSQLIRCPSCGATNRVPLEKVEQGLQPVCGRCKTPLPAPQKAVTVTDATFAPEVQPSPLPVLQDLWAAGGRGGGGRGARHRHSLHAEDRAWSVVRSVPPGARPR